MPTRTRAAIGRGNIRLHPHQLLHVPTTISTRDAAGPASISVPNLNPLTVPSDRAAALLDMGFVTPNGTPVPMFTQTPSASAKATVLTIPNLGAYWPLDAKDGLSDITGNGRNVAATVTTLKPGRSPISPFGDLTQKLDSSQAFLYDNFGGTHALGQPLRGEPWDTDTFIPTTDAGARMSVSNGGLTITSGAAGPLRGYARSTLPGPVQKMGCRFVYPNVAGNGGQVAMLAGWPVNYIGSSGTLSGATNLFIHLNVSPVQWQYQIAVGGTLFVQASGTLALVKDGSTVYGLDVLVQGNTIWTRLPGNTYYALTHTAIEVETGTAATFEVTASNGTTDAVPFFTEVWADHRGVELETSSSLNGTNEGFTTTYNPFVIGSGRTFFGVAKRADSSSGDVLMGNSVAVNAGLFLIRLKSGSNDVEWFINYTGGGVATGTWPGAWPGNGQVVRWALTVDDSGNAAELFINGTSKGVKPFLSNNTSWNAAPGNLFLGVYLNTGADWFKGDIGHNGVVERLMSASEISALHAALSS